MDPRVVRTRAAVLRAATDLLVEGGPNALTMDAVVARSGVAKSTIYRHWTSRDELLIAVIEAHAPQLPEIDPDADAETALRTIVRSSAASLRDPEWARMIPAMMLLRNHEADIKAIDDRLDKDQQALLAGVLQRAAREGLVRDDLDVEEALSHLYGPLLFAYLRENVVIDEGFADRIVDRFLAAHRRAAATSATS